MFLVQKVIKKDQSKLTSSSIEISFPKKILSLISEVFSDDNEHVSAGIAASSTF